MVNFAVGPDGPDKGTVDIDELTGAFTYIVTVGQTGSDTFTFEVTDAGMPQQSASGTVTVKIGEPDALVATTLTLSPEPGQTITGNLADQVSGGIPPYQFAVASAPTQCALLIEPDGTFTYTANIDATGTDSFTYTVTDSAAIEITSAATTTGTVNIVITALPASPTPSPTVVPSTTSTPDDGPGTGTVEPCDPDQTQTLADPRATATAVDEEEVGPVTSLPSTGSHDGGTNSSSMLHLLLASGSLWLGIAACQLWRRSTR